MARRSGLLPVLLLGHLAVVWALEAGRDRLAGAVGFGVDPEARRRVRLARAGERLARILGELKGVFAKAGQFLSVRHDLLPRELSAPLGSLQDRVPPLPWPWIRSVLEQELDAPLEQHFVRISPDPVGAASIAQVHRATLRGGREVAVKVQYPWIARTLASDLRVVRRALGWLPSLRRLRAADRARLLDELGQGLAAELDFLREARVAREIAANLSGDPRIVVPEVVPELTTRRVLTMAYHDALRIDDREALTGLGIEPAGLLDALAHAYARQVFVDGLFPADPHPGNLFALPPEEPGAPARVLFVDFGLSKRLDPELRREMRQALYAVLQWDAEAFVSRMERMGMIAPGARPGVQEAVEGMFSRLREGGGAGGALALSGGQVLGLKDEAVALLQETPGLQLPNDLLLYAKTLSYLFALGERLDPEVDLMRLCTPYLLRFLSGRDEGGRDGSGADPA